MGPPPKYQPRLEQLVNLDGLTPTNFSYPLPASPALPNPSTSAWLTDHEYQSHFSPPVPSPSIDEFLQERTNLRRTRQRRAVTQEEQHRNHPHSTSSPIRAYDCSNPKRIRDLTAAPDVECFSNKEVSGISNVTYRLLQYEHRQVVPGFSCVVLDTREVAYCGNYDHQTTRPMFNYELQPMIVSADECLQMIRTLRYKDPKNEEHPLKMDAVNSLAYFEVGKTTTYGGDNGESKCSGDKFYVNGKTLPDVVVAHRLRITLKRETFTYFDDTVYADSASIKLKCDFHRLSCVTPVDGTYVWNIPQNRCPLATSRVTSGMLATDSSNTQTFMSTDDSLVRLIITGTTYLCEKKVFITNYPDLYLAPYTKDAPFTRDLNPSEARISTYINNRDDYLYHHVINQVERELNRVWQQDCNQRNRLRRRDFFLRHNTPGIVTFNLNNGTFATGSGDVLYYYHCRATYVQAIPQEFCYDCLPVQEIQHNQPQPAPTPQGFYFMEPMTHRLRTTASRVPCSEQFRSKYEAANGAWIEASPDLRLGSPPLAPTDFSSAIQTTWDRNTKWESGGYIRPEVLDASQKYLEFGRMRETLSSSLSNQWYNVFPGQSDHVTMTGLFKEKPSLDWISPELSSWFEWMKTFGMTISFLGGLAFLWMAAQQCFNCVVNGVLSVKDDGCTRKLWLLCCPTIFLARSYTQRVLQHYAGITSTDIQRHAMRRYDSKDSLWRLAQGAEEDSCDPPHDDGPARPAHHAGLGLHRNDGTSTAVPGMAPRPRQARPGMAAPPPPSAPEASPTTQATIDNTRANAQRTSYLSFGRIRGRGRVGKSGSAATGTNGTAAASAADAAAAAAAQSLNHPSVSRPHRVPQESPYRPAVRAFRSAVGLNTSDSSNVTPSGPVPHRPEAPDHLDEIPLDDLEVNAEINHGFQPEQDPTRSHHTLPRRSSSQRASATERTRPLTPAPPGGLTSFQPLPPAADEALQAVGQGAGFASIDADDPRPQSVHTPHVRHFDSDYDNY